MFFNKMGNPDVGSFDVKAKKATLLGDGEAKVAFTAMAEYVLPTPLSMSSKAKTKLTCMKAWVSSS